MINVESKIRFTQPGFMHTGMEQITVISQIFFLFFPLQFDFIKYIVNALMKCTYANVQTSSVTVSGKQLFTCSATVRLGRERERKRNRPGQKPGCIRRDLRRIQNFRERPNTGARNMDLCKNTIEGPHVPLHPSAD